MSEKVRKTAFAVIASVMAMFTVWAAMIFCAIAGASSINIDKISNVSFDAADFTPIVQMESVIIDSLLRAVLAAILIAVVLIITLAVWGIFRLIAFRKAPYVDNSELIFSRRVFVISSSAAAAIALVYAIWCVIQAGPGNYFWSLLFCLPDPLFMWLFYMMKLRRSAA